MHAEAGHFEVLATSDSHFVELGMDRAAGMALGEAQDGMGRAIFNADGTLKVAVDEGPSGSTRGLSQPADDPHEKVCRFFDNPDDASPTTRAAIQRIKDASKLDNGCRRCHECGTPTKNPIHSTAHPDCFLIACSLEHRHKVDSFWVDQKHEMAEGDRLLRACTSCNDRLAF